MEGIVGINVLHPWSIGNHSAGKQLDVNLSAWLYKDGYICTVLGSQTETLEQYVVVSLIYTFVLLSKNHCLSKLDGIGTSSTKK